MEDGLQLLEGRIASAVERIRDLRERLRQLEDARAATVSPAPSPAPAGTAETHAGLEQECSRLLAERAVVRERIRELISELDRVSW